jgi:hypothetical protein
MSKDQTAFCRIIDYVEKKDSELAELFKATCADMSLGSLRGKPGITLLMPTDASFKKKLSELVYSSDPAQASKACDMLNALILRDVFKTPSDFRGKQVANSLYPSQLIAAKVEGNKVSFGSAHAVVDSEFKDSSKRQQLAVWKLSGEIPVTTDQPAKLEPSGYSKKGKGKGKTGGYMPSSEQSRTLRWQIAVVVENEYAMERLKVESGSAVSDCPYLKYTLSLLLWLEKNAPEQLENVLPLVAFDKLDLYLLLEPHKSGGVYLLSDSSVDAWWNARPLVSDCSSGIAKVNELLNNGSAAVFTNRKGILSAVQSLRKPALDQLNAQPRKAVEMLEEIYMKVSASNSIEGVKGVWPEQLAALYKSQPRLKMLQDDLRYVTFTAFAQLEESKQFDHGKFNEVVNLIGEGLHAFTDEEVSRACVVLSKNPLRFGIDISSRVAEISKFINSTVFLFVPLTNAEANELPKTVINHPRGGESLNKMLLNFQKAVYTRHNRVLAREKLVPVAVQTTVTTTASPEEVVKLLMGISDKNTRDQLASLLGVDKQIASYKSVGTSTGNVL